MSCISNLVDKVKAVVEDMTCKPSFVVDDWKELNREVDGLDLPAVLMLTPMTGIIKLTGQGGQADNTAFIFVRKLDYDSKYSGIDILKEREYCFEMVREFIELYNASDLFQVIKTDLNYTAAQIKIFDVDCVAVWFEMAVEPIDTLCL